MVRKREIEKLFAKASDIDKEKYGYMEKEEWDNILSREGAKIVKRKLLGICGKETIKTLEQTAKVLYETGIVSSLEEGREIVPQLDGVDLLYSSSKIISFKKVINGRGQESYRIMVRPWSIYFP